MITISRAIDFATSQLRAVRIPTPSLDATIIVGHVCGLSREFMAAHPDHEISTRHAHAITQLVARRCYREPLAYIIGYKWFFGLKIKINDHTLIPRPDTETLVERALDIMHAGTPHLWDIGTGSGAIACAVAVHAPQALVWASDVSREALHVARANARAHSPRVKVMYSDLAQEIPAPLRSANAPLLITANLPYIRTSAWKSLMPDVRDYEPKSALVAGPDGLMYYKKLLRQLKQIIASRPVTLLFEIDPFQYRLMTAWIKEKKLPLRATSHRDLSGRTRVIELTNAPALASLPAHSSPR